MCHLLQAVLELAPSHHRAPAHAAGNSSYSIKMPPIQLQFNYNSSYSIIIPLMQLQLPEPFDKSHHRASAHAAGNSSYSIIMPPIWWQFLLFHYNFSYAITIQLHSLPFNYNSSYSITIPPFELSFNYIPPFQLQFLLFNYNGPAHSIRRTTAPQPTLQVIPPNQL